MPIANVTSSSGSTNTVTNKLGQLKSADFIKMMITQLQNQDPMDPAKSDQLLSQMSQIGQLQASTNLTGSLKTMVLQNQIGSASSLIGKSVTGLNEANDTITGLVTSVKVAGDTVNLELDSGQTLEMGKVTQINGQAAQARAA